jgi:tRNA(fMet)-specific endonuclease VapC
MLYMLDTNICIYIIKQKPQEVIKKFTTLEPAQISVSSITVSELQYGVAKSQHKTKNNYALQEFLSPLNIEPFDLNSALIYGELRLRMEKSGKQIGSFDALIAAHAMSIGATLVTNNLKEFKRVKGLKLENWA